MSTLEGLADRQSNFKFLFLIIHADKTDRRIKKIVNKSAVNAKLEPNIFK